MILALKILLSPLCVVAVSLAGRRRGIAVAGVLGGLPVVAGPILLVETVIHGRGFGAAAAAATLLGLIALTAFVVIYGRIATDRGPITSVLAGWSAFLLIVAVLVQVDLPDLVSLVLALASFALGTTLLPPASGPTPSPSSSPWWDLPARAVAAACLVVLLTAVSGALGSHLSGLLAPFPVITSVLAVFTQAHGGRGPLEALLRNFLFGFCGFAAFCFLLAVSLPELAIAESFALATAGAIGTQAAVFLVRRRRSPAVPVDG